MDVAKTQQPTEEDPEFVRARRAAIDQLVNHQGSKSQRFARQDVMKAANVAKGFEQIGRKMPTEQRPTSAATATASAAKPTGAAAIRSNTRCESKTNRCSSALFVSQCRNGRKIRSPMNRRKRSSRIVAAGLDVNDATSRRTTKPNRAKT